MTPFSFFPAKDSLCGSKHPLPSAKKGQWTPSVGHSPLTFLSFCCVISCLAEKAPNVLRIHWTKDVRVMGR